MRLVIGVNINKPSTQKYEHSQEDQKKTYVRPEFCGWSALGPISLFIENIIGIYEINYLKRKIKWRVPQIKGKVGIKSLKFGTIETTLIFENNTLTAQSSGNYTLSLQNDGIKKIIQIKKGDHQITV